MGAGASRGLQSGKATLDGDVRTAARRFSSRPAPVPFLILSGIDCAKTARGLILRRKVPVEGGAVAMNAPHAPDPASTDDRYQLFGEIARGSMGVVLRGRDVDLGR